MASEIEELEQETKKETESEKMLFNLGARGRECEGMMVYDRERNRRYKILRPIGHWDYHNTTTVYEGILIRPQEYGDSDITTKTHVCLKICHSVHEPQWYKLARQDVSRNQKNLHRNIVSAIGSFLFQDIFFVAYFHSHVLSLRSLMVTSPNFKNSGIPEDCIAIAIKEALIGLSVLHGVGEVHRQMTASNIVFIQGPPSIRITFASTACERTNITSRPDPPPSSDSASTSTAAQVANLAPLREILKWGRAPEVVEDENNVYKIENYTAKSDIWSIGITALELAYGDIRVADHNALLDIASCINKTRKMPNTWEEVLEQTEKFKTEKHPKGKGKKIEEAAKKFVKDKIGKGLMGIGKSKKCKGEPRFSKGFIKMVAKCLYYEQEKRPTADEILKSKFMRKTKPITHFNDVMVRNNSLAKSQLI